MCWAEQAKLQLEKKPGEKKEEKKKSLASREGKNPPITFYRSEKQFGNSDNLQLQKMQGHIN